MAPEKTPGSSIIPNQASAPERFAALCTLADAVVAGEPRRKNGNPEDAKDYMEWASADVMGVDDFHYRLERLYRGFDGLEIIIFIPGDNEDVDTHHALQFGSDQSIKIVDENDNEVKRLEIGRDVVTPATAQNYATNYLTAMAEQKLLVAQQQEEDKRQAQVAEAPNFSALVSIDTETAKNILAQTSFNGETYAGRTLDAAVVEEIGLTPKYVQGVTDQLKIYFSDVYEYRNHAAVFAITQHGGQQIARTYYLSASQNVWRYLPAYGEPGNPGWFNKGRNPDSLNLPIALQATLGQLASKQIKKVATEDAELVLYGTVGNKLREHETNYIEIINPTNNTEAGSPVIGLDSVREEQWVITRRPEDLAYIDKFKNKYPDFQVSEKRTSYTTYSSMYGKVSATIVPSKDGTWNYLFFTDQEKRTWIGQVDINHAPISPTGLRTQCFGVGLITTPAYEYKKSAGHYGGREFGSYVDVYEKYLRRLQIIKDFEAHTAT